MPRYYFHLRHGSQLTIDGGGEDFPDDDAARTEAAESVHEILAEASLAEYDVPEAMVIVSEDGREVASVSFADAVPAGVKGR